MAYIPDAPPVVSVDGPELFIARDDAGDVKITADQVSDFVLGELTPAAALAKVIAASPETNGLNANLLQGLAASFFQNASNLSSGTVPEARLPQGEFNFNWASGGFYSNAGILKGYLKFSPHIFGGQNVMIQAGWSGFIRMDGTISVNFLTPFSSGFGNEDNPIVLQSEECRAEQYPADLGNYFDTELEMRAYKVSKTGFKLRSFRPHGGTGNDTVRSHWLAIGKY